MAMHTNRSTNQRLKVLFITAWYPTMANPYGGIFVQEHAKAANLYNDVVVIHYNNRNTQLPHWWQLAPIPTLDDPAQFPTYRLEYRPSRVPRTSYFVRYSAFLKAFQRLAQEGFRPDLIHAHIHRVALPAVLLGKIYKIPVVVTEQHSAIPRRMLGKLDLFEARTAFRLADKVLPVSAALQAGIEQYGMQARFQIVPNVVDSDLFYPAMGNQSPAGQKQLLCVATMPPTHVKGINYLLDALAQLQQQRTDWQLSIIGDGPERVTYEQQAQTLGLTGQVHFLGSRSKAEVAEKMRNAHIFVLPSIWDNMPCVLVEAMASGLPIVSTQTGGIPEIVNSDEIGLLAIPANADSLREILNRMLDRYPTYDRTKLTTTARQRYNYAAVGRQLDEIYRECIA